MWCTPSEHFWSNVSPLPMSAAVGTQGALDLCFELGTLSRLDDAAIFGAMEEVARWRSSTVPALLEVLEDELVLLWSPQIDRGAALLADLCSLVATCLAIREMFELRATQPTVGTPDMQDRHSGASKQLRGAMLHGGRPAKAS